MNPMRCQMWLEASARPPQKWDDPAHRLFAHTVALSSYLWLEGIDSEFERDQISGECRLLVGPGNEDDLVLIVENERDIRITHRQDGKKQPYRHRFFSDQVIEGYLMIWVVGRLYKRLPKCWLDTVHKNEKEREERSETRQFEEAVRRIEEIKEKHGFYGKLAPDVAAIRRREEWDKVNQYNRLIQKINKYAIISTLAIAVISLGVLLVR